MATTTKKGTRTHFSHHRVFGAICRCECETKASVACGGGALTHLNVVRVQAEDGLEAAVEWRHQCRSHVRVAQAQRVSELVGGYLEQICTSAATNCPVFRVVEVGIATVDGEIGMGQCAAGAVERVAVAVLVLLEADLDVDGQRAFRRERQIRVFTPYVECACNLLVNVFVIQFFRVLGYAVREILHLPSAALQRVPFRSAVRTEANFVFYSAPWQRHQLHRFVIQIAWLF